MTAILPIRILPAAVLLCIVASPLHLRILQKGSSGGYHVVHGWPIMPNGVSLGIVAGVGVDSHNRVFVFRRANRLWPNSGKLDLNPIPFSTVLVFDGKTGELV